MISRGKAINIAKDFLSRMNPANWDGTGAMPDSLDTRIVTYDIDSVNGNELNISLECTKKFGWTHYCELRDKETKFLVAARHGENINSVYDLVQTILSMCMIDSPEISTPDLEIKVPITGGYLVAERNPDPDYDGLYISFITDSGEIADVVIVESKAENGYSEIDTYCYSDANSEDYTHKFSLKTKDLIDSFK